MPTIDEIYQALAPQDQHSLLAFAQFLLVREGRLSEGLGEFVGSSPVTPVEIPTPLDIPRPESEPVIAAVRRLRETYPMLDRQKLFNDTADVVSMGMMGLRPPIESIDRLEEIFLLSYQKLVARLKGEDSCE